MKAKILIVDDNENGLKLLKELFNDYYDVTIARSGQESIDVAGANSDIAVVIMDIKMPGMDGIEAGRKIREISPKTRIIFHTGYPGEYEEDEIDKTEKPFDYVQKGRSATRLMRSVKNAVDSFLADTHNTSLALEAESIFGIIGRSKPMMDVYKFIKKISPTNNNVLIYGESGTGKELVAHAIHKLSKCEKITILHCNHKDPGQVESELFGHTKEAFSNAGERTGYIEYADGGTLFLDEIGDLDLTTQAKILRVVEYKTYIKIGDPKERKSNIRIICATNQNIEKLVENKLFRFDLYQRLNGVSITLPPLRNRREDIPFLIEKFSSDYTSDNSMSSRIFDQSAIGYLLQYDWPGNVRELKNVIERLIAFSNSELIIGDDVQSTLHNKSDQDCDSKKLAVKLKDFEKSCIIEALTEANYKIADAAEILSIERTNLHKKIKSHNIDMSLLRKDKTS